MRYEWNTGDTTLHSLHSRASNGEVVATRMGDGPPMYNCVLCVNQSEHVQLAISGTMPSCTKDAKKCLWDYVRKLKALQETENLTCDDLQEYADAWHSSLSIKGWLIEQTRSSIKKYWKDVRFAEGDSVPSIAWELCQEKPLPPSTKGMSEPLRQLASLCRELQIIKGNGAFHLSCRDAGRILGVSHASGNDWLNILVEYDILQIEKSGTLRPRLATTYIYLPNPLE